MVVFMMRLLGVQVLPRVPEEQGVLKKPGRVSIMAVVHLVAERGG